MNNHEIDQGFCFSFDYQARTQREKATMVQNMHLPMKTKMGIGCCWEMFHGSKSLSLNLNCLAVFSFNSLNLQFHGFSWQYVHLFLQEAKNHEGIRS